LVGESGCGKSITGLSILRLIQPPGEIAAGQILYHRRGDGNGAIDLVKQDPRGDAMRRIRGGEISMVFQEPMASLNPVYTVGAQIVEAVRLHLGVGGAEARAHTVEMLRKVGLPRPDRVVDSYPHHLSGGMCQRAMIAMALSCDPSLLIADEPTTALDVTVQAQILDVIAAAQDEYRMALLLITHDLGIVAQMASQIVVMYLGTVVEVGSRDDVFYSSQHPYTQALLRSVPVIGQHVKDRLTPVQGTVPDPLDVPPGCPFAPRCPEEMEVCRVRPRLCKTRPAHSVACWLYQ
jgi:oligopeptide/dipeptide ABC transporter ATP-binding protein